VVVTVKLFATFQQGRFEVAERELAPGTTVGALLDQLGIPRAELGVLLVSGRHAELDRVPSPGETISIFPLLGGG
jgi:molybdopterin synthase sulfur carrier subunit